MTGSLLGPLDYMFGATLRIAIVVAVVLALAVVGVARWRGWPLERAGRVWLLVTSLTTIWLFTQHSPHHASGRIVELNPFSDLRVAANTTGRYRDIVVANIALFVPLGIALAWRGTRFLRAVALGAAVSVSAEVLQYLNNDGRVAQTGDVVVNVMGVAVGWAIFVALTGGWGPLTRHDRANSPAQRTGRARTRETRAGAPSSLGGRP